MRVTTSMYYSNLYSDNNKVARELFDVNRQISSGHKIQYAYEGLDTFIETLRLDDEITTLTQVKESSNSGLKLSTQTDNTLNDLTSTLDAFKVKLIQAANSATSSTSSLMAIADDLDGMRDHMVNLANTSINGQYLFSGTALSTKPVNDDGTYNGNDGDMLAFLGSGIQQKYNVSGQELFQGDENDTSRMVTMNLPLYNQSMMHPDIMGTDPLTDSSRTTYILPSDSIRDLMGDTDMVADGTTAKHHFYVHGTTHEGTTFKEVISMNDDESVSDLLERVGAAFGNTANNKIVDVSLNSSGQIEIIDRLPGSSKLDFHMVANTDATGPAADMDALLNNGTSLKEFVKSETEYVSTAGALRDPIESDRFTLSQVFENSFGNNASVDTQLSEVVRSDTDHFVISGTDTAGVPVGPVNFNIAGNTIDDLMTQIETTLALNPGDVIYSIATGKIEIQDTVAVAGTPSLLTLGIRSEDVANNTVQGVQSNVGQVYDKETFEMDGNLLSGRVQQIVSADNTYAVGSTKLGAVASGAVYDSVNDRFQNLDGQVLKLEGIDINGVRFDLDINLNDAGSTVTGSINGVGGYSLDIYDAIRPGGSATDAGKMTYRQLMDITNMAVTGSLPVTGATDAQYDSAIDLASRKGEVFLNSKGELSFEDTGHTTTQASFSLYDNTDSDGDTVRDSDDLDSTTGAFMQFQANNALSVRDSKTDFFATIDEVIQSVRDGKFRADGNDGDPRNSGIQNALQKIDDLNDHVGRKHAKVGSQSLSLQYGIERSETLIISSMTLRSDVIDTDIAEASLRLQQLSLNYEALLSTVSRVSQLSLVNYI